MPHTDPAKRAEYMRRYRAANHDRIRERDRKAEALWREKNHDHRIAYEAQYRANNREKLRKKWREWAQASRHNEPRKVRSRHLKYLYGITVEQYEEMLEKQGGHCAACPRTPDQEKHGVLHVDHDHKTDAVRGLLCQRCNTGLGLLNEQFDGIVAYMQKPPS